MRRFAAPKGGLAILLAAAACGERPEQGRVFFERLGTDTTAMETLARTADGYAGIRLTRQPVTRVARYRAALDERGHVRRLEVEWSTPAENPEGPPARRLVVELAGDSATLIQGTGGEADTSRVGAPAGMVPAFGIPLSVATWEQVVRQGLASGEDPYAFRILPPNGRTLENALARRSADSVAMDFFGSPIVAAVSEAGRIEGISGRETTLRIEVRPVDDAAAVDLDALASAFAARDAAGEGFGVASPTDTVTAEVGGASLEVVYGRPAKRGREIWGGLVPYDVVWRTGANAATHFRTDRALDIGGTRVPAGTYTLWTTFTADSAALILNEQTQIWGTAYDPAHDFARVPLERKTLEEAVERFTISIEPVGEEMVLALAWDRARFEAPVRRR